MARRLTLETVQPDAVVTIGGVDYPVPALSVVDVVEMIQSEAALASARNAREQVDALSAQVAILDRVLAPGAAAGLQVDQIAALFSFLVSGGESSADDDAGASGVVAEDTGLPPTPPQ